MADAASAVKPCASVCSEGFMFDCITATCKPERNGIERNRNVRKQCRRWVPLSTFMSACCIDANHLQVLRSSSHVWCWIIHGSFKWPSILGALLCFPPCTFYNTSVMVQFVAECYHTMCRLCAKGWTSLFCTSWHRKWLHKTGTMLVPEEAVNAPSVRCGSECLDLELFKVACLH